MAAVDANGVLIRERVITMESDDEANLVQRGSERFIKQLLDDEAFYLEKLKEDKTPYATYNDIKKFIKATHCAICDEKFDWDTGNISSLMKKNIYIIIQVISSFQRITNLSYYKDYYGDRWFHELVRHGVDGQRQIRSNVYEDKPEGSLVVFHHNHATKVLY